MARKASRNLLSISLLAVLLSGCASLKEAPATFELSAPPPASTRSTATRSQILIPEPTAAKSLDSRIGMIVILALINLPIVVWMLYTYFKEIPGEILEAARMDGANLRQELFRVLAPMAVPGIASTILLNVILAWNEAFWTLLLTTTNAAPLSAFIASFSSPQGNFYAKLSAASTLAIAPILIIGWFSQKQLVRGLTFGAVK